MRFKTQYECMNNECRTVMLGGKCLDGMRCVRCDGPVLSRPYAPIKKHNQHYHFAVCLVCSHEDKVQHKSKEDYREVTVCPKCYGAFVDKFHIAKYMQPIEVKEDKQETLLSIELSDIDAAPDVYYKGEKVNGKIRVSFDWGTDTAKTVQTYVHIEHLDPDNKRLNTKVIQHNHPIVKDTVELIYID